MSLSADILIIGAGMAGVSVAAQLAGMARVVLLEGETQPAYHSTGRSAAMFTETYGNAVVRALTRASRRFLETPPDGFAAHALLAPRGVMMVATPALVRRLEQDFAAFQALCPDLAWLAPAAARRRVPALRDDAIAAAFLEPGAMELDVHALHSGYLRVARAGGCRLVTGARVAGLTRRRGVWQVETTAGAFAAPVVVNAAGAWADSLAVVAGVAPLGIVPKRRTAMTIAAPADSADWPLVFLVDESLYFKPESGRLLVSPADETATAPCDAAAGGAEMGGAAQLRRRQDAGRRVRSHGGRFFLAGRPGRLRDPDGRCAGPSRGGPGARRRPAERRGGAGCRRRRSGAGAAAPLRAAAANHNALRAPAEP
jgi:D-arginine dehydrogenase